LVGRDTQENLILGAATHLQFELNTSSIPEIHAHVHTLSPLQITELIDLFEVICLNLSPGSS